MALGIAAVAVAGIRDGITAEAECFAVPQAFSPRNIMRSSVLLRVDNYPAFLMPAWHYSTAPQVSGFYLRNLLSFAFYACSVVLCQEATVVYENLLYQWKLAIAGSK